MNVSGRRTEKRTASAIQTPMTAKREANQTAPLLCFTGAVAGAGGDVTPVVGRSAVGISDMGSGTPWLVRTGCGAELQDRVRNHIQNRLRHKTCRHRKSWLKSYTISPTVSDHRVAHAISHTQRGREP